MPNQSTPNKRQTHEESGLILHLKISESCLRAIVYLVLALSVGSGFVIAQRSPVVSPQVPDAASQQQR